MAELISEAKLRLEDFFECNPATMWTGWCTGNIVACAITLGVPTFRWFCKLALHYWPDQGLAHLINHNLRAVQHRKLRMHCCDCKLGLRPEVIVICPSWNHVTFLSIRQAELRDLTNDRSWDKGLEIKVVP